MASATRAWTLEELHRLPDDGNKYELVFGELFVTPPPNQQHETIAARLTRLLDPFVATHRLGAIYHPRAVLRHSGSEAEPDLMVRQEPKSARESWDEAPVPVLVVEIMSPTTQRRDQNQKRELYMQAGVAEYWIVDATRREVRVVRRDRDEVIGGVLRWQPPGVNEPLDVDLGLLFRGIAPEPA